MLQPVPVRPECNGREGITLLTQYRKPEAQREAEPLPMLDLLPVRTECSGRVGITFLTHHLNSGGDLIES
jgi:hypothetical protein